METFKKKMLGLKEDEPISYELMNGTDSYPKGYTMIGYYRLSNVEELMGKIKKVEGDVIECGVWRGGTVMLMKHIINEKKLKKKVYVADSFQGCPPPDASYPADAGDPHHLYTHLAVSKEEVKKNFADNGLLDDNVVFVPGWFNTTLKNLDTKFSLIRVDCDMYGSTMDVLQGLYNKLSIGGYMIIDDYGLAGCYKAVSDFRRNNNIDDPLETIDYMGVYWQKTKEIKETLQVIYDRNSLHGDQGHGDKGNEVHSYIEVYESILAPYRAKSNVLEIGVARGLSMRMWKQYFDEGKIFGIDIDTDTCPDDVKKDCVIIKGDATDKKVINKITAKLDVVIDDGSHVPEDQKKSFELLKGKMKKGGIYIIEDCSINSKEMYSSLHENCTILDRRNIKGQFNDVLVIYRF